MRSWLLHTTKVLLGHFGEHKPLISNRYARKKETLDIDIGEHAGVMQFRLIGYGNLACHPEQSATRYRIDTCKRDFMTHLEA